MEIGPFLHFKKWSWPHFLPGILLLIRTGKFDKKLEDEIGCIGL